jgi:hypothetical protein
MGAKWRLYMTFQVAGSRPVLPVIINTKMVNDALTIAVAWYRQLRRNPARTSAEGGFSGCGFPATDAKTIGKWALGA